MNEKGANIDLLFRNGLKDFEVLPPPDVWNGIHSAVKTKSRPVIFLRVAAVAAVVLTVSFFSYRWSREISRIPAGSVMAFNVPAPSPVMNVTPARQKNPVTKNSKPINSFSAAIPESANSDLISRNIEMTLPEQSLLFQETSDVSLNGSQPVRDPLLTPVNSAVNFTANSVKIEYPDLQYMQDISLTKPVNRWSVAAMASPTYYSGFSSGSNSISKQLMESEQSLFSYSGGVAFSYKISRRFSIQSGLYYSSLGQKLDGINSYSGFKPYDNTKGDYNFEVLTTTGTVQTSNPDVFLIADGSNRISTPFTRDIIDPDKASLQPVNNSLNQNFSYLELPVILRYKIVDKTIGINLIGGLSYNLLVHNSVYTTLDGSRYAIGTTKGLNPLALSSSLGMGMEYNISNKLSLNLEPTFRYYLNPFSVTSGSYIHPYSFGIFSGVSYKF